MNNKYTVTFKILIISLVIFLLSSTSSLGFYQEYAKESFSQEEPVPYVFGQMGENQWYISTVTIGFEYDPLRVQEIQYKLDNVWYVYKQPFHVSKDGYYTIQWKWTEPSGRVHFGLDITFKIDQSPPTIKLTKKTSGKDKVIFTANANDDTSLIERVEFYLDDVFQLTVNESPYQFTFEGKDQHWVYAIGYNFAGLLQKSENLSTPRTFLKNNFLIFSLFKLFQILFFKFYI
ncbi:MAG: Ig-like domain-containing protein [Candidatus Thermoplasmatota archaeon]|nr:Ig-like domain-containing protein [Candidatus Thermoplasmatota archaeon]